jgi:hypothetical protein
VPESLPINAARRLLGALALACLALGAQLAQATTVLPHNLADLIGRSDAIVIGTVEKVSDGFDTRHVPYTEVTLRVAETLRGQPGKTLSFRQYGLLKPREIDGRTYLGVAPEGFPRWTEREQVMLFLGKPARQTGLRTTVGLGQGKLHVRDGALSNEARNAGLFKDLEIKAKNLSREQQEMLKSNGKPVAAGPFVSLVKRAVDENWIGKGVMRHAQ